MAVLEIEEPEEEFETLVADASASDNNVNSRDAQLQARLKRRTAAVLPRPGGDQLLESSRRMLLSRFLLFLLLALAVWRLIAKEEKEDSLIPAEKTDRDNTPHTGASLRGGNSHDGYQNDSSPFGGLISISGDEMPSWAKAIRPLSRSALTQIQRYRLQEQQPQTTGSLVVNVHITHHGGTTFCAAIGRAPGVKAPDFACNNQRGDPSWRSKRGPWKGRNETAFNIQRIRQEDGLRMVSWEFRKTPAVPLAETEWEDPNLVSVLIARDPMTRLLSGDGLVNKLYPGLLNNSSSKQINGLDASSTTTRHDLWEVYAHDDRFTDNYALRILAGNGCCQGNETSTQHLQAAKALLQRFTVVLDIACLDQGIEALAHLLGITELGVVRPVNPRGGSPRERIGHDDIYEYLRERNQMDMRLYEWSKSISLVDCSKL